VVIASTADRKRDSSNGGGVKCGLVDKPTNNGVTLFLATETNIFVESLTFPRPLLRSEFKRRDNPLVYVAFLLNNIPIAFDPETLITIGVKPRGNYTAPFLAFSAEAVLTETDFYAFELNFNTTTLDELFTELGDPPEIEGMLEIEWRFGDRVTSSNTLPIIIHNDVITNEDAPPSVIGGPLINDYLYFRSGNGTLWQVAVDDDGVFVLVGTEDDENPSSSTSSTTTTTSETSSSSTTST
jgi:hypothetical protein